MIRSSGRRSLRRTTAAVASGALVAAGLGLGSAPAYAADSVVTGNVVDALGNPVSGYAEAYQLQADGTYQYVEYGDADLGHFEMTVPDGTYKFEFTSYTGVTEWYLNKADETTADAVAVGGGATALAAWTVEQPFITGTVVGADGRPVPDADIYAYDATSTTESFEGFTNADDKGNFVLSVGNTPVKLEISGGRWATEWYNDKPTFATADAVTGSPTGASVGVVTLSAGGAITGQVTNEAGAPLEMVQVQASSGSGFAPSDYTDKNGVYTIKDVNPGAYQLQFSDPIGEYVTEYHNNVTDPATATPVEVGIGQAVPVNAALAPRPAQPAKSVEATGVVKDELGVPVVGAVVTAWSTPAAGDRLQVETTRSNRSGVYVLDDLDQVAGENQFKISGASGGQGDDNAFSLFSRWYGGQQSYDRAAVLTTTPPTPVGADIVLGRAGGVAGAITGAPGLPLAGYAIARSADGFTDGSAASEVDGTFDIRTLPAGTYKVSFGDGEGFHAPEWWKDSSFEDAVEVTVKPGQLTGGLNAALSATLSATERPETGKYPWVGKAISAERGAWNVESGTTFSYEWLIGSTVVGTGSSYTPTKSQIGDKLTLRVVAENGRLVGSATSAKTAKIGYKPKVKLKVKGGEAAITVKAKPVKAKKVKGTVVVKEIVKVKDNGDIKYKKVGKTKIAKGKGSVSLAKLKKGKHKLVFFYKGKGKVGSTEVKKKVKVKR
jgi:protocatechuate 3,4-dioxygenase beta subunit